MCWIFNSFTFNANQKYAEKISWKPQIWVSLCSTCYFLPTQTGLWKTNNQYTGTKRGAKRKWRYVRRLELIRVQEDFEFAKRLDQWEKVQYPWSPSWSQRQRRWEQNWQWFHRKVKKPKNYPHNLLMASADGGGPRMEAEGERRKHTIPTKETFQTTNSRQPKHPATRLFPFWNYTHPNSGTNTFHQS